MGDGGRVIGNPDGTWTIDGTTYVGQVEEIRYEGGDAYIVFRGFTVVNECETCHRFDTRPRIAHSWQDAIERGWLVDARTVEAAHARLNGSMNTGQPMP